MANVAGSAVGSAAGGFAGAFAGGLVFAEDIQTQMLEATMRRVARDLPHVGRTPTLSDALRILVDEARGVGNLFAHQAAILFGVLIAATDPETQRAAEVQIDGKKLESTT